MENRSLLILKSQMENRSLKLSLTQMPPHMLTPLQLQAQHIQNLLTLQIPPQSISSLQTYADYIATNATKAFEIEANRLDTLLENGHTVDPNQSFAWQSFAFSVQLFHNLPPLTPDTLIAASRDGIPELVELLLASRVVDPTANNNYPIRIAAANGHLSVVKLLLPVTNPAARDNEALRIAAACGHTQIVDLILNHPATNPAARDNEALRLAADGGHTEVVVLLLNQTATNPAARNNEALRLAAKKGNTGIVRLLLESSELANYSEVLNIAADYGHTEIARMLLAFGANNDTPIQLAAKKGHLEIVRMLLPTARNLSQLMCNSQSIILDMVLSEATRNAEFYDACMNALCTFIHIGDCERIRKLLNVDDLVSASNFKALRLTIFHKRIDVLHVCLEHLREPIPLQIAIAACENVDFARILFPRITPNVAGCVLKTVMKSGNLEVIRVFIELHKFLINDAFYLACLNKNILCIRVLLTYPEIDPTTHSNYAIRFAVKANEFDLVRLLLSVGANPTVFDNYPLRFAMRNNRTNMIRLLLEDERVAKWSKEHVPLGKSSI